MADSESKPSKPLPERLGLPTGGSRALPANRPMPLQGPRTLWWVEAGKVDLFLVRWEQEEPLGARHLLTRVEAGGLFPTFDPRQRGWPWALLAIGSPDTRIVELPHGVVHSALTHPREEGLDHELFGLIERWCRSLPVAVDIEGLPPDARPLGAPIGSEQAPATLDLAAGQTAVVRAPLLWLTGWDGHLKLLGRHGPGQSLEPGPLPLPRHSGLQAGSDPVRLSWSAEGLPLLGRDPHWKALDQLHDLAVRSTLVHIESERGHQRLRLEHRLQTDAARLNQALRGLSDAAALRSAPPADDTGADPLLAACRLIGRAASIEFTAPPPLPGGRARRDPLGDILRASHVRGREVALQGSWWTQDHGHLLAFESSDGRPVALVCEPSGHGYRLHDPGTGRSDKVDAECAARLQPRAWMFYRPFGAGPVDIGTLMRFALTGRGPDLRAVALMAGAAALLGLVMPWATGQMIDAVIPHADKPQLLQLTVALVGVTLAISLLGLSQSFTQLRVEGKADATVQAAVWDRLLNLPVPFFRSYTAGDLALRANGISTIRRSLSGSTLRSVLAAVFSLFAVGLMAAQSVALTLIGCLLVTVLVLLSAGTSLLALRHERKLSALKGRLSGLLLQLLAGINKVRSAGAESRAFGQWAQGYADLQRCSVQGERMRNMLGVINGSYPVVSSIVLFAMIAVFQAEPSLSTGQFLVFSSAFGMLLGSMLGLSHTVVGLLNIIPLYERAQPLLQATPEVDEGKIDPGELDGRIDLHGVVFSYQPELPPILKGISLSIRAGEFVAIVGSSGSGKSTLLRLLLGFEQPTQGSITYSDRDLGTLDLQAVRRQLGVVLQNGQLMDGDLFTNIVGSRPLGLGDAQEAVRLAGMQSDLASMPMGLHTVVGDRGSTLSGGQRQRLLIAQAIVHKPRILFLDEATSALDHHTQMHVMHSFEQLQATRVVIAHRLSTVVNADRIVVLHEGRIAEQGRFDELVALDGLFAQMARRQIA